MLQLSSVRAGTTSGTTESAGNLNHFVAEAQPSYSGKKVPADAAGFEANGTMIYIHSVPPPVATRRGLMVDLTVIWHGPKNAVLTAEATAGYLRLRKPSEFGKPGHEESQYDHEPTVRVLLASFGGVAGEVTVKHTDTISIAAAPDKQVIVASKNGSGEFRVLGRVQVQRPK